MKRIFNALILLFVVYAIGTVLGLLVMLLRRTGKIKVVNPENLPKGRKKMLVCSNHPSLLEIFLIPALFFPQYFFHPFRLSPWFTPDKKNFTNKWYWFWLKPKSVPIERGNSKSEVRALLGMKRVLENNGTIILFPEGGRTCNGKNHIQSPKGKKIRSLKNTLGWLVLKTQASVLVVWVEGTDKIMPCYKDKLFVWPRFYNSTITIKIGELMRFPKSSRISQAEDITNRITSRFLQLADQEE